MQKITEALEADRATLYLLDEGSNELVSRIAQGPGVRSIRMKAGQGLAGYVARTGRPLHVRDAYEDAYYYIFEEGRLPYNVSSLDAKMRLRWPPACAVADTRTIAVISMNLRMSSSMFVRTGG